MIDLANLTIDLALIIKVFMLVIIALYIVFVVVAYTNIRALHKVVLIEKSLGSPFIQLLSLLYLLASISLFIAAVVIL